MKLVRNYNITYVDPTGVLVCNVPPSHGATFEDGYL